MTSCSSSSSLLAANSHTHTLHCPRTRHILSGTFNTPHLHLLRFDTLTRALTPVHPASSSSSSSSHNAHLSDTARLETAAEAGVPPEVIPARGPHQFLTLGKSTRSPRACGPSEAASQTAQSQEHELPNRVYATTWAEKAELSAWEVVWGNSAGKGVAGQHGDPSIRLINSVPITSTSSYVTVYPPALYSLTSPSYAHPLSGSSSRFLYSAGGPTGEVHQLERDGRIGEKLQEVVFLAQGEQALHAADKTRKALRYGAHSIDISPSPAHSRAYVADLGRNAILVYSLDASTGKLHELVQEVPAYEEGDGPRHVVPSPDGKWIASITEHTSYVDIWAVPQSNEGKIFHVQRADILPAGSDRASYRGDTLRLSPSGHALLASTRGKTSSIKGHVRAWAWDLSGKGVEEEGKAGPLGELLCTWTTPTSGGKANAIEWAPRYPFSPPSLPTTSPSVPAAQQQQQQQQHDESPGAAHPHEEKERDWAVLTDDQEGLVLVLQWDGKDLQEVARVRLQGTYGGEAGRKEGQQVGASHAVWLS